MRVVYQANDGSVFKTEQEAVFRDNYVKAVDACLALLQNDDLPNAKYRQISHTTKQDFLNESQTILDLYHGKESEISKRWKENPSGFVGRILDDSGLPSARLYWAFQCIDAKNRLWNQPFYAKDLHFQSCADVTYWENFHV